MKPTYEELEAKLLATEAKLAETLNLLKLALDRISILEEKLNKNSNNSSKPPSTDRTKNSTNDKKGFKKRRPEITRKLLPPDQIDDFHTCALSSCPPVVRIRLSIKSNHLYFNKSSCLKSRPLFPRITP